mmetsp:Transcript_34672/g.53115  ORF Transcript_34672/g.53115 Transcript_34672/m.53115 type:complete len:106 (-) Transcript_34672:312-629(-)
MKHQKIAFSFAQSLKLFCLRVTCFCCRPQSCCQRVFLSRKTNLQNRLLREGEDRLESDFRIEKVIKHVRDLRAHYKQVDRTPAREFDIQTHPKNVINLDSDYDPH